MIPECEATPPGCNEMKWPWAVGSQPVIFPQEAGMPMGEGRKWYALQHPGRLVSRAMGPGCTTTTLRWTRACATAAACA